MQERKEQERAEKVAELERQKAEVEEFERRTHGGRRRRQKRDRNASSNSSSFFHKMSLPVLIPVLVVILSMFIYWLLSAE